MVYSPLREINKHIKSGRFKQKQHENSVTKVRVTKKCDLS